MAPLRCRRFPVASTRPRGSAWTAAGVVAVVAVLAACGSSSSTSTGAGSSSAALATKQELVIAAPKDTDSVAPPESADVAMGYGDANAPVFESLVLMAPDFTIHPWLATSWDFVAPNTWRFHLRTGVTFQNGAPFNAAAVAWNINTRNAKDPNDDLGVNPNSAKVVDDSTVDITPTNPNERLVEQLVHPLHGMIAPNTYPGAGDTPADTPTGTGPFKFVSYTKGSQIVVSRYDGYWGTKPTLTKITIRFIPDDNARTLALKAGDVNAVYDVPREQASDLESDPSLRIVHSGVGAYDALLLNHHGKAPYDILNDLTVRQAVAYGIDKDTIVKNVWHGNAEVMQTVIPAPVLGQYAGQVKGFGFDQAKAKSLLDGAGWTVGSDGIRVKAGRRLQLTLVVVEPDLQRPMPELVVSELKDIGVDVKLNVPGDPNTYYDALGKGQGDMFAEVGNQNNANPIFLGALFTAVQPGGFSDYGAVFGAGSAYDTVFTQAFSSPDVEKVRSLAAQAMHIAVDQDVATVAIAGIYRIWGLSKHVQGFEPHPSNVNQKWNAVSLSA